MAIHNTTLWSQQLKKLKKDLTPKYIYIALLFWARKSTYGQ
jgi:hypothetical protein